MPNSPTYQASDYFMTRTPILPISHYQHMFKDSTMNPDQLLAAFQDPVLQEALLVASPDLYYALQNTDFSKPSRATRQIISSLTRYFIRMTTRPTPFGLFAGISIGHFGQPGEATNITIASPDQHTKRARPDMEWIYNIIKQAEANPDIRQHLPVRFNDFTYQSGNRIEKPDKTALQHTTEGKTTTQGSESTSIRYTAQVQKIQAMAQDFVPYGEILQSLTEANPAVPPERIETFLAQLLENEYLISKLRPPLTNTDVLDYIINTFENIGNTTETYATILSNLRILLQDYNKTPVGKGIALLQQITATMAEFMQSKNYLQVDMKLATDTNTISPELKETLEDFANAMAKIGIGTYVTDEFAHYKSLFLEKYGYGAEIPVLELLDADKGLGCPTNYGNSPTHTRPPKQDKPIQGQHLENILTNKTITALKNNQTSIAITDTDIASFHNQVATAPLNSFEVFFTTQPDNEYPLMVSQGMASNGAGKAFGRFYDMVDAGQISFPSNSHTVEIAELPTLGRLSNITSTQSPHPYSIAIATNPPCTSKALSINDLFIGINPADNNLYIKSKSLGKKIRVAMTSMLNPLYSSNTVRFLREISDVADNSPAASLINLIGNKFIYNPRVTYKNIVLKPETWVLSKSLISFADKEQFETKFAYYCKKYNLPQYIQLNQGDNSLQLDTTNPYHVEEIYNAIKSNNESVTFTELLPSTQAHSTEIVVPYTITHTDDDKTEARTPVITTQSDISSNAINLPRITLLPGQNNWLYYKLYGGNKRYDELLATLYHHAENMLPLLDKYFFLRYADPKPHIRIRFQAKERELANVFVAANQWIEVLQNDGLINTAMIDSYQPETLRYGGASTIAAAETYFFHNSRLVLDVLQKKRFENMDIKLDTFAISFIIGTLDAFGLDDETKEKFLSARVHKDDFRDNFKIRRRELMDAVDTSHYPQLAQHFTHLKAYADAVYAADKNNTLTNAIQDIIGTTIHMFCNRLMGDNNWEHMVYALARHAFYAQQSFLKSQHKMKFKF